MNTSLKYLALVASAVIIVGCNSSGSGSAASPSLTQTQQAALRNSIYLDQLAVVPVKAGYNAAYVIRVNNDSKDNYTIKAASITDPSGKLDKAADVAIVAQAGANVPANGSYSIQFSPKVGIAEDVLLNVTLADKLGKQTTVRQLVRLSDEVGSTGGLGAINDISRINTKNGNYSLSIPVILTKDFDKVTARNGSLLCNAPGFKQGNSCSLLIKGTSLSKSLALNTRLTGYRNGKEVAFSDGSTQVNLSSAANLLISHGVKLANQDKVTNEQNKADVTANVYLFNSGNSEASNIVPAIADNSALSLYSNSCSSLASGEVCSFAIKASKTEVNGFEPVTVSYNTNSKSVNNNPDHNKLNDNNTNSNTASNAAAEALASRSIKDVNVRYSTNMPDMSMVLDSQNGNLENTLIGDGVSQYTFTLKNDSNHDLSDMKIMLPSSNSGLTTNDNCTGKAGTECTITVNYNPTTEIAASNLYLNVTGKYLAANGVVKSYVSRVIIPYSAVAVKDGVLAVTSNDMGNMHVMLGETGRATVTLKNTAKTLPLIVIALFTATDFTEVIIDYLPCQNKTLQGGESCKVEVTYGPYYATKALKANQFIAHYSMQEKALNSYLAFTTQAIANPNAAYIKAEVAKLTSPASLTGSGTTSNDPYKFMATSTNRLKLKYTFTNLGGKPANQFQVSGFPANVDIVNNNCGIEAEGTLNSEQSCSLEVSIPAASLFNLQASSELSSLLMADIELPISYSYTDTAGSKPDELFISQLKRHVQFNRSWATTTLEEHNVNLEHAGQADAKWVATYKVKVNVASEALSNNLVSYPLTVKLHWQARPQEVTFTDCQIASANSAQECTVSAQFPVNVIAEQQLKLEVEVAGANTALQDKLYIPVGW